MTSSSELLSVFERAVSPKSFFFFSIFHKLTDQPSYYLNIGEITLFAIQRAELKAAPFQKEWLLAIQSKACRTQNRISSEGMDSIFKGSGCLQYR